jgi:hypothetical protein
MTKTLFLDGWIVVSLNYMQHVHFAKDLMSLNYQEFGAWVRRIRTSIIFSGGEYG